MAKQLVSDDAFSIIAAPQFAPDNKTVLFVASGPPLKPLPGVSLVAPSCEPALLCFFARPLQANGLPWDLWLVTVDGARFQQLTHQGYDSPWPAWSHAGKYIAWMDTGGIYMLDVARQVTTKVSDNGGHGVFSWWSGD